MVDEPYDEEFFRQLTSEKAVVIPTLAQWGAIDPPRTGRPHSERVSV